MDGNNIELERASVRSAMTQ